MKQLIVYIIIKLQGLLNLKIEFLFFWNGSILNLNRVDANNEGNNIFLYKEGGDGQQITH